VEQHNSDNIGSRQIHSHRQLIDFYVGLILKKVKKGQSVSSLVVRVVNLLYKGKNDIKETWGDQ